MVSWDCGFACGEMGHGGHDQAMKRAVLADLAKAAAALCSTGDATRPEELKTRWGAESKDGFLKEPKSQREEKRPFWSD